MMPRFFVISGEMVKHCLLFFLFISYLILSSSCNTQGQIDEETAYIFHTRKCLAINVNNAWMQKVDYQSEEFEVHGFAKMILLQEEQIDYDRYLLRILVNEKKRDYPFFVYPHIDGVDWADPDPAMEQALYAYFENRPKTRADYANTRADYSADFRIVEYRTEPLEYIRVTADVPLFGRESGNLLDDKWDVYGEEHPFFFDSSKHLIQMQYPWGSMDEYLGYSPMAPAILYLQLNEKPKELPVTLRFAVELKVEGKEPFRDTTRTVTLL